MDIRLRALSHSSSLLLHSCPRKYQLKRLNAREADVDTTSESVTFSFGHVVGLGIQELLSGSTLEQTYWKCFLIWKADLLAENVKQNKSFWLALHAVEIFAAMRKQGLLADYELVYYSDKPAVELSFIIKFPDGFTYKGFLDFVLRHKETGAVIVVDAKTTSASFLSPAMYKNSGQALGYSVVLDAIIPDLSSYEVMYLPYKTKSKEYEVMQFTKDSLSRAYWIRQALLDIELIKLYESQGIYPQYGESCFSFYRECEFFGLCGMSTERLVEELEPEEEAEILRKQQEDFTITLTLEDLIQSQLEKEKE